MWTWLKEFFGVTEEPKEEPRKKHTCREDAQKATVVIEENDGTKHTLSFQGYLREINFLGHGTYLTTAKDEFREWRNKHGKTGLIPVGNDTFVPLCNIKSMKATYEENIIEYQSY